MDVFITSQTTDYKLLRMLCIFGGSFSPVVTYISTHGTRYFLVSMLFSMLFSLVFFFVMFASYRVKSVKKNAYLIICVISYIVSAANLFTSYYTGFDIRMLLVMILISLSIILVFRKLTHLIYYESYIFVLMGVILYTQKTVVANRGLYLAFLAMFGVIAYFYVKIRLEAQEALKKSEEDNRNLLEASPQAIVLHRQDIIAYANPTTTRIFAVQNLGDLIGKSIFDFVHPDCRDIVINQMAKAKEAGNQDFIEQRMIRSDGEVIDAEVNIIGVEFMGEPTFMSIIGDITQRKTAERKLIEAESKYRNLVESALVGVYLFEKDHLIYVNPYLEKLLGYTKQELYSMNTMELFVPEERDALRFNMNPESPDMPVSEYRIIRKDGSIINVETSATVFNHSKGYSVIGTLVDITHLRKAEERIKYMAYHDALTGLPNRYMLVKHLDLTFLALLGREFKVSVLFIDLDRFKDVNDTMGHSFGDLLLQSVSERLKKCARKHDMISRYGGDEFVMVLNDTDRAETSKMAQRILNRFSVPFNIGSHEVLITPSIGISSYPEDGTESEELIKNADTAMYHAKTNGKNNFLFYSPSIKRSPNEG